MVFLRLYMLSVVALVLYIVQPGINLFSWHPVFMTVGSMIILYEGVLFLVPNRGLLNGASRDTKRNVHGVFQIFGLFIMMTGFACVVLHKKNLEKDHFNTLHGVVGVFAGCLSGFAAVGGLCTRFQRLAPVTPQFMRLGHVLCGLTSFFLVCLTFVAGVFSDYMTSLTTPFIQFILISLPLLAFGTGFTHILNRLLHVVIKPK